MEHPFWHSDHFDRYSDHAGNSGTGLALSSRDPRGRLPPAHTRLLPAISVEWIYFTWDRSWEYFLSERCQVVFCEETRDTWQVLCKDGVWKSDPYHLSRPHADFLYHLIPVEYDHWNWLCLDVKKVLRYAKSI